MWYYIVRINCNIAGCFSVLCSCCVGLEAINQFANTYVVHWVGLIKIYPGHSQGSRLTLTSVHQIIQLYSLKSRLYVVWLCFLLIEVAYQLSKSLLQFTCSQSQPQLVNLQNKPWRLTYPACFAWWLDCAGGCAAQRHTALAWQTCENCKKFDCASKRHQIGMHTPSDSSLQVAWTEWCTYNVVIFCSWESSRKKFESAGDRSTKPSILHKNCNKLVLYFLKGNDIALPFWIG